MFPKQSSVRRNSVPVTMGIKVKHLLLIVVLLIAAFASAQDQGAPTVDTLYVFKSGDGTIAMYKEEAEVLGFNITEAIERRTRARDCQAIGFSIPINANTEENYLILPRTPGVKCH